MSTVEGPAGGGGGRLRVGASAPAPLTGARLDAVPGVLGTIARERAADYAAVEAKTAVVGGPPRPPFGAALTGPQLAVIAEVKRSSPSQGPLAEVDPLALARVYHAAGASAISVLTEARHFGGSLEHLTAVAEALPLPLLRKDFVVHPLQLSEARALGASAALLIVAVLGPSLAPYLAYAEELGLECLVEVHDETELRLALEAGARILGANNRDLRTLEIDRAVAPRLLRRARALGFSGVGVAESGYRERSELEALAGTADGVLVGSSLAGSDDPAAALTRLVGVAKEPAGSPARLAGEGAAP